MINTSGGIENESENTETSGEARSETGRGEAKGKDRGKNERLSFLNDKMHKK